MKAKSIFAATLLVAGAAFADSTTVETDYVLGVMPVSASGKTQVILSVPWVAEGSSADAAVTVTNLVKTAGLGDGDKLTWYNPSTSKYMAWEVETNDTDVAYWKPVDSVGETSTTPSLGEDISRGEAIVLTRAGTSNTIYVIGQVGSESSVETVVAGNGKYTLVAPPMVSGTDGLIDLNTITWGGTDKGSVAAGDVITVDYINGIAISYTNDLNGASAKWVPTYMASGDAKIKVGRGFWYYRAGASDLTITWSAPSTSNN